VRVFFAAPGHEASMTLEHVRLRGPVPAGSVRVEQPGNDVSIVLRCTPACDPPSLERLQALAGRVLAGQPGRFWVPASGFAVGREHLVAFVVASVLAATVVLFGLIALWRGPRISRSSLTDAVLVAVVTGVVTVLLGEASVANWYSNNLPALGGILDADDQGGIAGFFLQAAVRMVLPWTDRTLFGLNLVLHAVSGALFYLAFRSLLVQRGEAWLALLLWAVLPMTLRIGWSDAMHVQVELLFALLLLAWLRGQDERHWPERWLAPALAALLPFVRFESSLLAPLPLLFGPLVGNRAWTRRMADAVVYGVCLALSAGAVFELFVQRYSMPIPDLAERLRALCGPQAYVSLVRQFGAIASGMPNWFPAPAAALLVIGCIALAVRQPARLLAIVVAFCLPQVLLDRLLNAEGMVGARYFLPVLALLALVATRGLAVVAEVSRRLAARYVIAATANRVASTVVGLGVVAVVHSSLPLYHYEYAFQGEERFLRHAMAALPVDARLLHLPVRGDDRIHADPDCCLDLPKSPLALAFPRVHFEPVAILPERPQLPAAVDTRTYYYEGALCRLGSTPFTEGRNPGLSRVVHDVCASLARDPRLELVASARVPPHGMWEFLQPGDVPLRLYRIRRSEEITGDTPVPGR